MKIRKLVLDNFRCFERLKLDLGETVNLLIGDNGSGKTAIIDALSIGLGPIATHLPDIGGISFKKYDLQEADGVKKPFTRVFMESFDGIQWDVTQHRDKSPQTRRPIPSACGTKQLLAVLNESILNRSNSGLDFDIPVFASYGVSRAILDIPLRRKGFQRYPSRFSALSGALQADRRFRSAFIWFYTMENQEHRLQKAKRDFDATLKELDVVRNAISTIFPDLSDPHIAINPLRFMLRQDGELLYLDQLSDGYKTMLGLIIDLASRFAMANIHLPDPLVSEAIVMIDEIDLHLHPAWQQRIIGDMLKTFPNTQFIFTTHSPFILEALNNHLKREKICNLTIGDQDLRGIVPLNQSLAKAYIMENKTATSILDESSGLIDDKFLHVFNDINAIYDRMRDLEWEHRHD